MDRTFFQKIWDDHTVADLGDGAFLIHIDRNFLHEVSGAVSLKNLDAEGRSVRCPELTFATLDHVLETVPGRGMTTRMPGGNDFLREFSERVGPHGIRYFDLDDPRQGIVHVIAPELGAALPGMTFICGDSHTCTVGGVGAFAWGVGSSDSEHALATQTVVATKPKTLRVNFTGTLPEGVFAKDMILALIGKYTANGGTGYAIEYAGEAVASLSMDGRLTLCNMAVEFGGRTGMVAPDDITFEYLKGREFSPTGDEWDRAVEYWRSLRSDPDAKYDAEYELDCSTLTPQVTWGTSPEHVVGIAETVPDPAGSSDAVMRSSRERAASYAELSGGQQVAGLPIEGAFIGSCTNSRIDDLRAAAEVLRGRKVAPGVTAICVPGSTATKLLAEAEGLDKVFIEAGFEWRESGCSLCMSGATGGESFPKNARVIASTNRNFEDRQGPNVRSHLASPVTVAASAIAGHIMDHRQLVPLEAAQ
ncbi:3-isopropylmalate dehydratase large subunit [Sphingobium sp. SCG-1]|uniref:3-isopropylmalate dehydratase large subunit n=1 Tax=Sphingobium sp. SCG-1 TaxID=2072936 RepID=UPI000CD67B74|nr:3-isopropylmalate dehydratase large subunit [Sphingobium sp. SCG-1]AUW58788.1 3-isopropylmalate dehydratase large subunit [Sphingobium sp. SCG-1]